MPSEQLMAKGYNPGDHEIELVSGLYLDLVAPDSRAIRLTDIAHGLAHTCRYAGHTHRFYSVAEHAVMVARKLKVYGCAPEIQLVGLHHDDPEAYVADIARPLKTLLQPAYGEITRRLEVAIEVALGLPRLGVDELAAVKVADDWALACEAYHLLPSKGRGWWSEGLYDPDERPCPSLPVGFIPEIARKSFLDTHAAIVADLAMVDGVFV